MFLKNISNKKRIVPLSFSHFLIMKRHKILITVFYQLSDLFNHYILPQTN